MAELLIIAAVVAGVAIAVASTAWELAVRDGIGWCEDSCAVPPD